MSTQPKVETRNETVLRRYETYGLFSGLWIGLLAGVLYSGPNFYQWQPIKSLLVVLGFAIVGAILGFLAIAMAAGSIVQGSSSGTAGEGGHGDFGGGSDGGGGGDG